MACRAMGQQCPTRTVVHGSTRLPGRTSQLLQPRRAVAQGGGGSGSRSGVDMRVFMSPRVSQDELHNALVELFAYADLPFRLVDRASFRRFVALLNPSAKDLLGSRYRLARDMQAFSEVAREELRQEIFGDGLTGRVSLSLDIWTSENHTAFMCVTVHWITSDFRLRSGILDFVQLEGSHTGSLIAQTLERILTEAGLQDVVFAVTTDNAENNNKAMRLLSGDPAEGPGAWTANSLLDIARHVRCLAHVMNIAVQEALKLDDVKEALKRLRDACSYIGWSVQRSEAFVSLQRRLAGRDNAKVLRLISDSPTRWGSTYEMICRALELQQALTVFSSRTDVSDRLQ
ncbi:unnamed protein product [Closterium sp. NIES-65]|nr:unnamed protein product [Closterium sp. NIES-65]